MPVIEPSEFADLVKVIIVGKEWGMRHQHIYVSTGCRPWKQEKKKKEIHDTKQNDNY